MSERVCETPGCGNLGKAAGGRRMRLCSGCYREVHSGREPDPSARAKPSAPKPRSEGSMPERIKDAAQRSRLYREARAMKADGEDEEDDVPTSSLPDKVEASDRPFRARPGGQLVWVAGRDRLPGEVTLARKATMNGGTKFLVRR